MKRTGPAVIFDLEYTAWEGSRARNWSGPGEHREIVQIGAVLVDPATHTEIDRFDRLVIPAINSRLSAYFTDLTGITQARLEAEGSPFADVWGAFEAFIGDGPLYCYGWDQEVVADNIRLSGLEDRFTARPAHNLHDWCHRLGIDPRAVSSGALAAHVGAPMTTTGRAHDALHDCRSQLAAIRHLVGLGAPSPFTMDLAVGPVPALASPPNQRHVTR